MSLLNPFPGPQPYRAADRARFFGRKMAVSKLANQILARPATTVFGPSGAGKSSLMQAGVIPALEDSDGLRVVRVDAWPCDKAPLPWLVDTMVGELHLGALPEDKSPLEALEDAIDLAERRSDRPILIYLDQIEQLFVWEHAEEEMKALLEGLDWLIQARHQDLHLVLSVREDYLGRVRDWTRERAELSAHSFRVGPLSVGEMVKAMCRTAAEGEPAQRWDEAEIRGLMLEVRVAGQRNTDAAEVQTAFGQIVCRALWEERVAGEASGRRVDAEAILRRYLDATVEGLGRLQEGARKLLEEHLIDEEGHRTLLTEKQARLVLPGEEAAEVLSQLELSAVLHAEEHQGSRYFELGHDWLAKKVFERRLLREKEEAEQKRSEEEARKLGKERAARRRLRMIATAALVVAVIVGVLRSMALEQRDEARKAQKEATAQAARARDATATTGARELLANSQPALGAEMLLEVRDPDKAHGWTELAMEVVAAGLPKLSLHHGDRVSWVAWSPDGKRIVTTSDDETARLWNADGSGAPITLKGHESVVSRAAWSHAGSRIVTVSADRTARVWSADGAGAPIILKGHGGVVLWAAWSPDDKRIVTTSDDNTARVWSADGSDRDHPLVLEGHTDDVLSAAFSADGSRIVTVSYDTTARVWDASGADKDHPLVLRGDGQPVFTNPVVATAFSPTGNRVIIAFRDRTAWVWRADGSDRDHPLVLVAGAAVVKPPVAQGAPDASASDPAKKDEARAHFKKGRELFEESDFAAALVEFLESRRLYPAWSSMSGAVSCLERLGRSDEAFDLLEDMVRDFGAKLPPGVMPEVLKLSLQLRGMLLRNSSVFSPDGRLVITTNAETAWVWNADGSNKDHPLVLQGHQGTITSARFSADGKRVVTASQEGPVEVWTLDGSDTGHPLVLRGHWSPVTLAAWSPDGKRVVTASSDKTARIWPLTIADLQQALRDATTDCLSPYLRATYLDESDADARKSHEACERSRGPTPLPADAKKP